MFCIAGLGAPQAGEELLDASQQAGVFFLLVTLEAAGAVERLDLEDALAQGVVGVFVVGASGPLLVLVVSRRPWVL